MKDYKDLIKSLIKEAIIYQWPTPEELSIMRSIAKKQMALYRMARFTVSEMDEIRLVSKMIKYYLKNDNDINAVIERFDFEIGGKPKPTLGNNWEETLNNDDDDE